MRYYVAVNRYRSATSDGCGNTWEVMECDDRKHQAEVLARGLVVRDCQSILDGGSRGPCYSTNGVRLANRAEIREARSQEEYGHPIQSCEPFRGVSRELVVA